MSEIETVIFDLGGVLIDWNPRHLYRKIFEEEQVMEDFLNEVCNSEWNERQDKGRSFSEAVLLKQKEFPEFHDAIAAFHSRWTEMISGPIVGTVELLSEISTKRSIRLYALTNWSAETFPYALANFDFLRIFEGILVSGKEELIKPDPEIYLRLLQRYDIEPSTALFIDDSMKNVLGAKSCGINSFHFTDPVSLRKHLESLKIV